jgi:hypothetical protein
MSNEFVLRSFAALAMPEQLRRWREQERAEQEDAERAGKRIGDAATKALTAELLAAFVGD